MIDILVLFVSAVWNVLGQMAPYLILGYLIAGVLSVFVTADTVSTHLGGSKLSSTVKAALFGMPLPLCSCSVIPVTASLHKNGAGRGAVASFLISTPTTGVDSILAAWALMGPVFAIYRAVMSVLLGITTGVFVNIFGEEDISFKSTSSSDSHTNSCGCEEHSDSKSKVMQALNYGFITIPKDLTKSLLLGILIAGFISALIQADFIDQFLGSGIGTMLIMLVVGIPLYICATASIPLALGFIALGASPGAAFVFLVAGPATNAATITVLWRMIGKRSTVILLLTIFAGALGGGLLLDALWTGAGPELVTHDMHAGEHAGWFNIIAAIVFLAIQFFASYRKPLLELLSGGKIEVEDSCCSAEQEDSSATGCSTLVQEDSCCASHKPEKDTKTEHDCCNAEKEKSTCCSRKSVKSESSCCSKK